MTTINNLSTIDSVSGGDQVPVFDESAGTARKMSVSQLLAYFAANFASPEFEVQTAAPTLSGFTLTLTASAKSIWAVLSPTGAFAAGTIVLPPVANCFDGQMVIVTSGQAITALTVNGNGATVNGAPSGLGTNGFFQLRYYALTSTWWCVAQSLGSLDTFDDITITGDILSGDGEVMLAFAEGGDVVTPGQNNSVTVIYSVNGAEVGVAATGDSTNIGVSIIAKGTGTAALVGGDVSLNADAGVDVDAGAGAALLSGANVAITANTADVSIASTSGNVVLIASSGFIDVQDRMEFSTAPRLTVTTVAALPATPLSGMIAIVTDASATTQNSIVAGGGANRVVVFYDGTNWRIG